MRNENPDRLELERGRVEVICSGEMARWLVTIFGGEGPYSVSVSLPLNTEEMGELIQLLIRTGRVLAPIGRTNLLGRICTALPELHEGFQFDLNRKEKTAC